MHNSLRDQAAHELYNSPKSDNYQGWDPYDLNEEAEKNNRVDPCGREKKEIRPENTGDCAAGAYHRHLGMRGRKCMGVCRDYAAEEIEHNEPQVPEPVFDIVSEYPKIKHVAANMKNPAMHKHRGKYREYHRYWLVRPEAQEVLRNRAVCMHKILAVSMRKELEDKKRYI